MVLSSLKNSFPVVRSRSISTQAIPSHSSATKTCFADTLCASRLLCIELSRVFCSANCPFSSRYFASYE